MLRTRAKTAPRAREEGGGEQGPGGREGAAGQEGAPRGGRRPQTLTRPVDRGQRDEVARDGDARSAVGELLHRPVRADTRSDDVAKPLDAVQSGSERSDEVVYADKGQTGEETQSHFGQQDDDRERGSMTLTRSMLINVLQLNVRGGRAGHTRGAGQGEGPGRAAGQAACMAGFSLQWWQPHRRQHGGNRTGISTRWTGGGRLPRVVVRPPHPHLPPRPQLGARSLLTRGNPMIPSATKQTAASPLLTQADAAKGS